MTTQTRFREIGETIETGDICRTIEGFPVPAVHSVGRLVRRENVGYVVTHKPHTKESLDAQEIRLRNTHMETYEVHQ